MRKSSVQVDHISNGQGYGDVADALIEADMNPAVLRPWKKTARSRQAFITVNGKNYATNAQTTTTKDQWKFMDSKLVTVARPLLRVWSDLVGAGLTYTVPDGMATMVLQEQTITDGGSAQVSMDALVEGERDRPTMDIRNFPLPIVHGDVSFPARGLAMSRRGGTAGIAVPWDTTMLEQVTRRIVEKVELMAIGQANSFSYGGGTVYGLTTKPQRLTSTMTLPTDPSWSPALFVDEINEMISDLQDIQFNGPYGMYFSPNWSNYLNGDYASTYGGETLGTRLDKIDDISFRRKIRFGLSGYQVILFELNSTVIRAVTGMRLQTIQWDTKGGLSKNFKIMGIMVPQLRSNADDQTGINHGVAA